MVAISSSRESSWPRDRIWVSCTGSWILDYWATREAHEYQGGLSFPSPGDLPNPRIKPMSPASPAPAGGFFTTETPEKPLISSHWVLTLAYHLFPSNLPISWHSLCLIILVCGMDITILPILKFNERIKQENPYSKTQNSTSHRVNAETMFTLLIITCRNLRK